MGVIVCERSGMGVERGVERNGLIKEILNKINPGLSWSGVIFATHILWCVCEKVAALLPRVPAVSMCEHIVLMFC